MLPLIPDPRDNVFRKMLVLSVAIHAGGLLVGAAWTALRAPAIRIAPVAVVDLVGGREFADRAPAPSKEDAREAEPPPPAAKPPKGKEAGAAKTPRAPAREPAAKPATEPAPPDAASLAERIALLREERRSSEKVREAIGTIRREKDVRTAVRRIGERVARRVDLSAAAPPSAPRPGPGGAVGDARISPEHLAYFRRLDEKIRSNWTVPDLALREAKALIVQLRIRIERNGTVSDLRLEKTSGNAYFDDSVRRAIRKASPLPVPPDQLRGAEDHYDVGFRFFGGGDAT